MQQPSYPISVISHNLTWSEACGYAHHPVSTDHLKPWDDVITQHLTINSCVIHSPCYVCTHTNTHMKQIVKIRKNMSKEGCENKSLLFAPLENLMRKITLQYFPSIFTLSHTFNRRINEVTYCTITLSLLLNYFVRYCTCLQELRLVACIIIVCHSDSWL